MNMSYDRYKTLKLNRPEPGILEVVMGGAGKLGVADATGHAELAEIWRDIDADPDVSVAIIRGEGKGFSGGGSLDLVEQMAADFDTRARVWREARDLVYNLINCSKIVVSAMHGPAVGAGLVTGLLADISIAARNARIIDGHTRLGVAAGDHAICCCAKRSAARRPSASAWFRCAWRKASCGRRPWRSRGGSRADRSRHCAGPSTV
jgi:enoyl-CoA hydratase